MRCNILLVIFLFLAAERSSAQGIISGKVSDRAGKPVQGAIVSLLSGRDSSVIKMSVADKRGYYTIVKNGSERLLLKVEKEQFETQIKAVGEQDTVVNFELTSVKALEEVVITSRKKLIEEKSDRTVFNVENSVVAFGGDALEALKKMPGVQVQQQQIQIAGNNGVSIMVNGRLQHLSGDELIQFLRSIPANNLSKIELITSPGAKYDAAGNAGIINLVMKKNIKDGLTGSISAGYNRNTFNCPSGSLSMQYKTGKFNFYTTDNISEWRWLYRNDVSLYYANQRWQQTTRSDYINRNARVRIGVDYEMKKNMTLGFVYTRGFGGSGSRDHISSLQFLDDKLSDSIVRTEGAMHEVYRAKHTANINYEWKIDTTGKKLSVSADYFSQKLEKERNLNFRNYGGGNVLPQDETQNRIYENPAITIRSASADLELPYNFLELSIGAKASFVDNAGDFIYQTQATAGYTTDSSKSNSFLYQEQIQAGYVSAKKKIKRVEMRVGVRAERTLATGITPAVSGNLNWDYTKLFPSVNIGYRYNEHHNFVFSYMRRIERPGYNLLNPFKTYYTPRSYQQGNPALQPDISDGFLLSWFINTQYRLRLRVNRANNYWDRVYFTDSATGTSFVSRANLGKGMMYIFNFSFSESVTKWWELNGEVSGTYNQFWLNAYGSKKVYTGISGWAELNNTFYLNKKKTLVAELNGYYYSPRQKDYKLWKAMYNIRGGIKALLLDKTLTIGFAFDDPFASSRWFQTNKGNGTVEYSYDDQRSVSLSVSYRFGNKNLKVRKERVETSEEIQRAR